MGLSFDTLFSDADVSKTRVLLSDALSDRSEEWQKECHGFHTTLLRRLPAANLAKRAKHANLAKRAKGDVAYR